jgi:hypothetical protein
VFFHNPHYAAGAAPKHAPTTSGEHLRRQFLSMQIAAD